MSGPTADPFRILLPDGSLTWIFPTLPPAHSVTEIVAEGCSNDLFVTAHLSVPFDLHPRPTAGPPWRAEVWIDLVCDVEPTRCGGHHITEWVGPVVDTPLRAAQGLRAGADWAVDFLTTHPMHALRARDGRRGHAPAPTPGD